MLGPTLFLIYINDLPHVVHYFVILFADDAKLYAVDNTVDDTKTVRDDLSRIDNWSDIRQIRFNYKKCNHMHLGKEQQFRTYFMTQNGEPTKINKTIKMRSFKSSENIQKKRVGQTDLFRIINPLQ